MALYATQPDPYWHALQDFDRLADQVNRLFRAARRPQLPRHLGAPAVNVWQNEEGALLAFTVPGISADSLDISVLGDTLTVRGKRPSADSKGQAQASGFHRAERPAGEFVRTITLPHRIDAERVEALYRNGVLQITAPRAAADKPQRISVRPASVPGTLQ